MDGYRFYQECPPPFFPRLPNHHESQRKTEAVPQAPRPLFPSMSSCKKPSGSFPSYSTVPGPHCLIGFGRHRFALKAQCKAQFLSNSQLLSGPVPEHLTANTQPGGRTHHKKRTSDPSVGALAGLHTLSTRQMVSSRFGVASRRTITSAAEQKTVGIGDTLPSVPCFHNSPKDSVDLSKLFENKTGVLFALPGAFTPG